MVSLFIQGGDGGESDVEDQQPRAHQQCNNRHLTTRRHTVGPGDTFDEDVMGHPLQELNVDNPADNLAVPKLSIIPNMNLPANIPLLQGLPTENFSVKNPHLLRPPPYMGASAYCTQICDCRF
jgi:serine/threonine-protein kinase SIK3